MTEQEAARRIAELASEIRRHEYLYYVRDAPVISDAAFDEIFAELKRLEGEFPGLLRSDSPTQRVGGEPLDGFVTVEHAAPMLSLDSSQDESALRRFDARLRKALGTEVTYVVEPKLDGASVELVYEAGVLTRAATRGDGVRGERITENVRTIPAVPLRLREDERPAPPLLSVRGEIIMHAADFEALNERLIAEGKTPYANPRNVAAGAVRQLDPKMTASRPLDIFLYDILKAEGVDLATQTEVLEALADWGLKVSDLVRTADDADQVLEYHRDLEERRDDLGFEIDGVVVKLDDLAAREELGSTSHHPRWAYAHKFPPRREITRILKIIASVGRTGVVTPVALMNPVEIGGVTVSRATLHNREEVERKDVREGDKIRVQRAGDVIPQVIGRVEEPDRERGPAFRLPDDCPSCGTPLTERGPFTVCPNSFDCPAQLAGRIIHFGSRKALDIEGLGEESARLFVENGLVHHLHDLFELEPDRLIELEGFAEKSANRLVEAIGRAARAELARFLYALGIPEVGATVAAQLARHFRTFEAVRAASEEKLQEVSGIGPRMAAAIVGFFAEPRTAEYLDQLLDRMEILPDESGAEGGEQPLAGVKIVFTGTLDGLSRSEAKERAEALGARVVSSVSGATTYLVTGSEPGSKLAKAEKLGVEVLDTEGFLELLAAGGA